MHWSIISLNVSLVFAYAFSALYPANIETNRIQLQSHLKTDSIKIGLLISFDTAQDRSTREGVQAVQMAVNKVNKKGGINGKPVKLITRSCNGKWGSGSKQAVTLIYDYRVCALLGSLDGQDAHLVEQVATKAQVVFLSSKASDPSLSQTNIPWFFRCIPNDEQQASILLEEICNKKKLKRLIVITDNTYDNRIAANAFLKKAKLYKDASFLPYGNESGKNNFLTIGKSIRESKGDGIIFFGKPGELDFLLGELKSNRLDLQVFAPIGFPEEGTEGLLNYSKQDKIFAIFPVTLSEAEGENFRNEFRVNYGYSPRSVAAFSYDGINILLKAIKRSGEDRQSLRKALATENYQGVTGEIKFDSNGNRMNRIVDFRVEAMHKFGL